MNYFKKYEMNRNHLKVGAKWESMDNYGIVEIINVRGDGVVIYRYTQDGFVCDRTKKDFLDNFKPYNEAST